MKNAILLLRICYWWGILADAVSAILMLFPNLFLRFMKINLTVGRGFSYGLRYNVTLMVGWTILLYWADRKPLERKDILLLTLPVVAGYCIFEIYSLLAGFTVLAQQLPLFIMQVAMSAMFIFSYVHAKRFEIE
jgi:hypothetical protein